MRSLRDALDRGRKPTLTEEGEEASERGEVFGQILPGTLPFHCHHWDHHLANRLGAQLSSEDVQVQRGGDGIWWQSGRRNVRVWRW